MDKIDFEKLDKLALGNSIAKQRQRDEMVNMLRYLGNFFSFVGEAKISAIADRLIQARIGSYALNTAVGKIADNFDKFPSYKVIYELCRAGLPANKVTSCDKCADGLVSLYEKSTGINYAFSCSCESGTHYPSFASIKNINLNLFTRIAPFKLGDKVDPYEGFKEKWQEYLIKIGKIT